jgi:hypothetical protein
MRRGKVNRITMIWRDGIPPYDVDLLLEAATA